MKLYKSKGFTVNRVLTVKKDELIEKSEFINELIEKGVKDNAAERIFEIQKESGRIVQADEKDKAYFEKMKNVQDASFNDINDDSDDNGDSNDSDDELDNDSNDSDDELDNDSNDEVDRDDVIDALKAEFDVTDEEIGRKHTSTLVEMLEKLREEEKV